MPVFISYSHEQKGFVDILAANLFKRKINVWVDRWELGVGDSIINQIQEAITEASALLIVLSRASVESAWCKKEIESGLLRELEAKRVIVLPVMFEDCEIPIFLRGKVYADFRKSFDDGLASILDAIAKVTSESLGRSNGPLDFHTDWGIDWGTLQKLYFMRISLFLHSAKILHSIYLEFRIIANERFTSKMKKYEELDIGWIGRLVIYGALTDYMSSGEHILVLQDNLPQKYKIDIKDKKTSYELVVDIEARRLGEDNGKDIALNYGEELLKILSQVDKTVRKPTSEELSKFRSILEPGE